jgi:hypothetical protein
MGWMNRMRLSGKAKRADPLDETVINGEPYDPYRVAQKSAAARLPEAEIPEEIRRRQSALLVNYVRAVRAR